MGPVALVNDADRAAVVNPAARSASKGPPSVQGGATWCTVTGMTGIWFQSLEHGCI